MLLPDQRRDLRKSYKRILWFILGIFLFDAFICYLFFRYTNMHPVLNGFIIICITAVLYLLFLVICAKIDKKKKEKMEANKNKDPFTKK